MKHQSLKKVFRMITLITTFFLVAFILYAIKLGILEDKMILVEHIKQYGIFASLFFVLLQTGQVILPVIPGGASCLAGVLAFGPIWGFIYNYFGLILGSLVAFQLSRTYGIKVVENFFSHELIDKYLGYVRTKKFQTIFFWGILLPGLPDDLLCYIAGLSKMEPKTFLLILLIGKPLTLILYSFVTYLF